MWRTLIWAALLAAACGQSRLNPMPLTVTSSAFRAGEAMPPKYTGDGQDISPPLAWSGIPEGIAEIAVICDDPDAPRSTPWVHWVIYKIPPDRTDLPEGVSKGARPPEVPGAVQGRNDFGSLGYGGPAPPRGHGVHRYRFHVYALTAAINAPEGLTKEQLLDRMRGKVLAEGEIVGTYQR